MNATTGVQCFHTALALKWPRSDVYIAIPVDQWTEFLDGLPTRIVLSRSLRIHPMWILLLENVCTCWELMSGTAYAMGLLRWTGPWYSLFLITFMLKYFRQITPKLSLPRWTSIRYSSSFQIKISSHLIFPTVPSPVIQPLPSCSACRLKQYSQFLPHAHFSFFCGVLPTRASLQENSFLLLYRIQSSERPTFSLPQFLPKPSGYRVVQAPSGKDVHCKLPGHDSTPAHHPDNPCCPGISLYVL